MPHIIFNGKPAEIDTRITRCDFLQTQELEPAQVIVELNGEIVACNAGEASPLLQPDDRLNVFRIVAGG